MLRAVASSRMLALVPSNKSFELISGSVLRRAMSSFLIEDPKYSFLKDLGLQKTNPGGFNGKWFGSGKVSRDKCFEEQLPESATGERRLRIQLSEVCRMVFPSTQIVGQ